MHEQIKKKLTESMKARDTIRTGVLRSILASFTNEAVAMKESPQTILSDEKALAVIKRIVKQHKDSINQFSKADRKDLVEEEEKELVILEEFLPPALSAEDVERSIDAVLKDMDNPTQKEIGRIMGAVMKATNGQADGSMVKEILAKKLA